MREGILAEGQVTEKTLGDAIVAERATTRQLIREESREEIEPVWRRLLARHLAGHGGA